MTVGVALEPDDDVPISVVDAGLRRARRTRVWRWTIATMAAILAGAGVFVARELADPIRLPPVPAIDGLAHLFDRTPTVVVVTANWQKVTMTVPRHQFLSDHTIWRRMHFEDWDRLVEDARTPGLRGLLDRYGALVSARDAWPTMSPEQWDQVPQPIRAMAFVGMQSLAGGALARLLVRPHGARSERGSRSRGSCVQLGHWTSARRRRRRVRERGRTPPRAVFRGTRRLGHLAQIERVPATRDRRA